MYIDSHSHLSDERMKDKLSEVVFRAQEQGVTEFLQAGVGPQDWESQLNLSLKYKGILPVFGIHPYFVSDHTDFECQVALDHLGRMAQRAYAIGETGLDFRPKILKDSRERQIDTFVAQIEIAKFANKPLVLHIVQAFDEAIQIFDTYGLGHRGGFVHSFNGSDHQAKAYLDLGLSISIGCSITYGQNTRLRQAVSQIPLEFLLLETDCPDQPPVGIENGNNEPIHLIQVAKIIGEIKKMPTREVLDKCSQNTRKLIGYDSESRI